MSSHLLDIAGLHKRFGKIDVLGGVDLALDEGEFVALLGPSGCGKTTLLKIVAGFEPCSTGTVALDGEDLLARPPHRRPVNTVFQRYLLFPHLNVRQNVAYGLRFDRLGRSETRRRVDDALEMVRLGELAERRSDQLSGGQAQRVSLARALVKRPRLLLLDEPLSALDVAIRLEMQRELRRIHRETGMTFLFVTHDQQEAMALADRLVVMRDGVVEQSGSPSDIYDRPATRFVAQFVGDANLVPYTMQRRHDRATGVALDQALEVGIDESSPPSGLLVLRPDVLRVCAEGGDGAGRVIDVAFAGVATTYSIQFGQTVVRVIDRTPGPPEHGLGDRVRVRCAAASVVALPSNSSVGSGS